MKYLFISFLLLTASTFAYVEHSASIEESESRTFAKFSEIVNMGSYPVTIVSDKKQGAELHGDKKSFSAVATYVENGVLYINKKKDEKANTDNIKITVRTNQLSSVTIKGSGSVKCPTAITTPKLDLMIQGSGNISMDVDADKFSTTIQGSGNVELSGKAMYSQFKIEGSGNIDAVDLKSSDAAVSIAGSGNCKLYVSGNLDAEIKGSGNVMYSGTNKVKGKAHGSGKIKSL